MTETQQQLYLTAEAMTKYGEALKVLGVAVVCMVILQPDGLLQTQTAESITQFSRVPDPKYNTGDTNDTGANFWGLAQMKVASRIGDLSKRPHPSYLPRGETMLRDESLKVLIESDSILCLVITAFSGATTQSKLQEVIASYGASYYQEHFEPANV